MNEFQVKMMEAIKNAPPKQRQEIYTALEKEIKEQRAILEKENHAGSAIVGGDTVAFVEMQMMALRQCAKTVNNPDKFWKFWLQQIVVGIILYEDHLFTIEAVKDATTTQQ